ncbi:unnamed protein product [Auanema sp. JU1783]|nr:unnamed protein product [Auanema sp. JU1783]
MEMSLFKLIIIFYAIYISNCQLSVNQCVLRCKDNHMREMDNEWSTDFTLPLISLVQKTNNESAALHLFKSICNSNQLLEKCLSSCNKSQETAILLAGSKSWEYSCGHIDEVKSQFTCWRNHAEEISIACRATTVLLRNSMLQFTKNQSEIFIEHICSDYDKFSTCFTQEHGRLCGLRSEVITGRMFHGNREAIFNMLKMKWSTLPTQCGYSQLRRDTYYYEKYSKWNSANSIAPLPLVIFLFFMKYRV